MQVNELPAIFADFVAQTDTRYALTRPFRDGDYVVATNGRIIVRQRNAEWVDPDPLPNTPKTAGLFTPPRIASYGEPVPLPDPGLVREEQCEKCLGDGECTCASCGAGSTCPTCGGTGTVIHERAVHILDDYCLRNTHMAVLLKHGVHHVRVPSPRNYPARFKHEAFEGLVMPCNKELYPCK